MFNGEPVPASAAASRNVVRSSSISGEICGPQQAGDGTGTTTAKKRRSSLGAKMVAIVGLTQWSRGTLQLPQAGEGCGPLTVTGRPGAVLAGGHSYPHKSLCHTYHVPGAALGLVRVLLTDSFCNSMWKVLERREGK